MGEFDLIKRYFQQQILVDDSVQLSIGDDCALVSVPENYQLAITTDTMVENTHFFYQPFHLRTWLIRRLQQI